MIFVSVGTHEQPMDRLFLKLEELLTSKIITESIFVQSGFSHFTFKGCQATAMLPFPEMERKMREARIIICHGGPATLLQARMHGKVPLAVPRQAQYGEHVNDHQVSFVKRLGDRGMVIPIYDLNSLGQAILDYDQTAAKTQQSPDSASFGASTKHELCRKLTEYCQSNG